MRNRSEAPEQLQARLLKLVLRVSVILGVIVYVPSIFLLFQQGLYGVIAADTVALSAMFGLFLADRIPYRWRAAAVCFIFYALGIALLSFVGSISQVYLFAFSIVTVLLLGARMGLGAAVISSISLLLVGALGHAAPEMKLPNWKYNFTEWAVISINFTLVNVLLTLGVGVVLGAVKKALGKEVAIGVSLAAERKLLRNLIDALPDVVFTKDREGRLVNCTPAALARFGATHEEDVAGKSVFDLFSRELAESHHADDLAVMAGRAVLNREERSSDPSGNAVWHLTNKVPMQNDAGEIVGLIEISRDITVRKQAEAERDRLLAQLQLQIENMPLAYLMMDRDFRYTRWNPAAERIFGFTEAEALGKHPFELIVPPESQALSGFLATIKPGALPTHAETPNRTKSGALITCDWNSTPMFDADGNFMSLLALVEDVTEIKKLEEQLRQSQKMEAIGQLAGGVAHDFNNLLSVVLSYSDLMLENLKPDNPIRGDIEEIRRAGKRAADLTRQLLMFSRRQVMEPRVLDLNEVLAGVDKMLRRVVGEDIELTSRPSVGLGQIRADPGSIDQVIMNLAVNARDAMPIGGKLTLETANVELDAEYAKTHIGVKPGRYVMLSVTDTGTGMDKATLGRIFEPFFTTKGPGKGTGLGLSTVFGIAQQSGGTVWVYSELGVGTTFKVYLPRIDAASDDARTAATASPLRGSETVLLVEDEEQVRNVALGILRRHGYTVLEAHNAGEALLLCEQHAGAIDLLLSDVVMPQMSGPALAKRLVLTRPDMKVLCMSGYTDDAAIRHGVIAAEFAYLQKPLTVETLTRKVREVLDAH